MYTFEMRKSPDLQVGEWSVIEVVTRLSKAETEEAEETHNDGSDARLAKQNNKEFKLNGALWLWLIECSWLLVN